MLFISHSTRNFKLPEILALTQDRAFLLLHYQYSLTQARNEASCSFVQNKLTLGNGRRTRPARELSITSTKPHPKGKKRRQQQSTAWRDGTRTRVADCLLRRHRAWSGASASRSAFQACSRRSPCGGQALGAWRRPSPPSSSAHTYSLGFYCRAKITRL